MLAGLMGQAGTGASLPRPQDSWPRCQVLGPRSCARALSSSLCSASPRGSPHGHPLTHCDCLTFPRGNEGSKRVNQFPKVTKVVSEKHLGSSPSPAKAPHNLYPQSRGSNNPRTAGFIAKCKRKAKMPDSGAAGLPCNLS